MRSERRRYLLRILRAGHATTQQEIAAELRSAGHEVTQATVSRDLRDIGAVKVRIGDRFGYRLPDEVRRRSSIDRMSRNLERTLDEFAVDVTAAASLVVVATAPGHAAAVARAIDLAGEPDVVGTVAGDDTIFVATPNEQRARRLVERWARGRAKVAS